METGQPAAWPQGAAGGGSHTGRVASVKRSLFAHQRRGDIVADCDGIRQAIKHSDLEAVREILRADSRLGRYVDPSGQSMLHLACMFSDSNIVMELIRVGADPGLGNTHGETAFDLAPPAIAQKMFSYIEAWTSDDDDSSEKDGSDGGGGDGGGCEAEEKVQSQGETPEAESPTEDDGASLRFNYEGGTEVRHPLDGEEDEVK